MLNKVVLVGRLTRDAELRFTPNGVAVANFTLAVERKFAKDGKKETDFLNCVIWNKSAEATAQYTAKGLMVAVDGEIHTRSYDNKEGVKVYVTEVVCDNIKFLEYKNVEKDPRKATQEEIQPNVRELMESEIDNLDDPFMKPATAVNTDELLF